MKHIASTAAVFAAIAVAAYGASDVVETNSPRVIEIEVKQDELAACQQTLADVAQMPAYSDNGSRLLFSSSTLPEVRCVVTEV